MASRTLEEWQERGHGSVRGGASLADGFYPLYQWLFDEDDDFVAATEQKLAEARMADTVEEYLSRALGIGVVAGLALWLVGVVVGYLVFATGILEVGVLLGLQFGDPAVQAVVGAAKFAGLVLGTGLVLGVLGFAVGFGVLVAVPYNRAASRRREINVLLPDAVSYMYALSVGGLNQIEILETMAGADDTYGEVAREFQSIIQDTEYFDADYRTSIRKQVDMTPSDELAQFFTDMLAIINSGGSMEQFLADKKRKHMRTAKQQQERVLDTLELFGEMYITLSLFPLLLIIVIVVMSMLGEGSVTLLYLTVYGLIPLIGAGFLVLVATVMLDDPGDGYLREEKPDWFDPQTPSGSGLFRSGAASRLPDTDEVFAKIRRGEVRHELREFVARPHLYFRDHPLQTLLLSVPLAVTVPLVAVVAGLAPTTAADLVAAPVWGTVVLVHVPLFVVCVPLAVFHEWNLRARYGVLETLSEDLHKLAAVNDTGMTLLESIGTVADTSSGRLADEFQTIYLKVNYGMSINQALHDFNNRYHIPRLARTVKLVSKAQSVSNEIRSVLSTAAKASENRDDIQRERRSRTRMQVAVIVMTFLTLLAVIAILKTQFLTTMADLSTEAGGQSASVTRSFGGSLDVGLMSLLFFHALTIQAVVSGLIAGYVRNARLLAGVKYVLAMLSASLAVWVLVG